LLSAVLGGNATHPRRLDVVGCQANSGDIAGAVLLARLDFFTGCSVWWHCWLALELTTLQQWLWPGLWVAAYL